MRNHQTYKYKLKQSPVAICRLSITMSAKSVLILILSLVQVYAVYSQQWVPSSMTAAEMWNPATWYYPYGIAAAEAWSSYLKNAQQATNQLYQQWHATGASNGWWSGGQSSGLPGTGGAGGTGGLPGQAGQADQNVPNVPS